MLLVKQDSDFNLRVLEKKKQRRAHLFSPVVQVLFHLNEHLSSKKSDFSGYFWMGWVLQG